MPVYPPQGGAIRFSPSSSSTFASGSLNSTTPTPGPSTSLSAINTTPTQHLKQKQKAATSVATQSTGNENASDGTPSPTGSGNGNVNGAPNGAHIGTVKFLLALNAPDHVPWGFIRAKVRESLHPSSHPFPSIRSWGHILPGQNPAMPCFHLARDLERQGCLCITCPYIACTFLMQ